MNMTCLMIDNLPTQWRALQDCVARLLNECCLSAATDVQIQTVRGRVNVDVLAENNEQVPPVTTIIECKLWKRKVSKTVVHSLRTLVNDCGANWGWIVSAKGFQS